ncbi:MAG: hypothetical protein ABI548_01635 [Polyangiaceae bacterium]
MTELRYDIVAVGEQQLRSVIRGIESEIIASNRRMTAQIRGGSGGGRTPRITAGGAASESRALARTQMAEDRAVIRARESDEKRLWSAKVANVRRFAQIEIQEGAKANDAITAGIKQREKLLQSMQRGVAKSVTHAVGGAGRMVGGAASIGGGILIASALHDQMNVQAYASRVANQGERPDLKGQLASQSQTLKGFTGEEALSALDQFTQKSGNLQAGIAAWQMIGKVSLATSSDITEVGEAAGSAFNLISRDTKDPIERMKLLKDVMENLAIQGNRGSIEMRDFAVELPKLAAAASKFGGGPGALKMMAALSQLAVKNGGGAVDASDSSTAVMRFTDDLIKDARSKKGKPGLDVFTDKTNRTLRDPAEIISDIMDDTGGDLTKIGRKFGMRGMKALGGVSPEYNKAFDAAEAQKKGTGKAAGREAVHAALGAFTGANMTDTDLNSRAQLRLDDPDLQFKEAMKAFNVAIGTQLLPAVTKLIPPFVELVPLATTLAGELAHFLEALAQNPYAGIGGIIAGKVALDLTSAGIGAAAKAALGTSIGALGALDIAAATMTVAVLNLLDESATADANKRFDDTQKRSQDLITKGQQEYLTTGKISPKTRKQLETLRANDDKRQTNLLDQAPAAWYDIPSIWDPKRHQNAVDGDRAPELRKQSSDVSNLLRHADIGRPEAFTNAARDLGVAADKLTAAATRLGASGPSPRTTPIVGR